MVSVDPAGERVCQRSLQDPGPFCPKRQMAYAIAIGVYVLFFLVTTVLYYKRSRYIYEHKIRSIRLTILQALTGFILSCMILITSLFHSQVPCFIYFWVLHFGCFLWTSIMFYRVVHFVMLARQSADKLQWVASVMHDGTLCDCPLRYGLKKPPLAPVIKKLLTPIRPSENTTALESRLPPSPKSISSDQEVMAKPVKEVFLCRHRCHALEQRLHELFVILLLLLVIYCAVMQALLPGLSVSPMVYLCHWGMLYLPMGVIIGIDTFILCPVAAFLLWRLKDAYHIRNELLNAFILSSTCLGLYLFSRFYIRNFLLELKPLDFFAIGILGTHILTVVVPLIQTVKNSPNRLNEHGSSQRIWKPLPTTDDSHQGTCYVDYMRVLSDCRLFGKLKITAGDCFCPETMLFLEDYQRLKSLVYSSYLANRDHSVVDWLNEDIDDITQEVYVKPTTPMVDDHAFNDSSSMVWAPPTAEAGMDSVVAHDDTTDAEDMSTLQTNGSHASLPRGLVRKGTKVISSEKVKNKLLENTTAWVPGLSHVAASTAPSFIEFPTPITYTIYNTIDECRRNHTSLKSHHTHTMIGQFAYPEISLPTLDSTAPENDTGKGIEHSNVWPHSRPAQHSLSSLATTPGTVVVNTDLNHVLASLNSATLPPRKKWNHLQCSTPPATRCTSINPGAAQFEPGRQHQPNHSWSGRQGAMVGRTSGLYPIHDGCPDCRSSDSESSHNINSSAMCYASAQRLLSGLVTKELKLIYDKFFSPKSEFTLSVEKATLNQIQVRAEQGLWKLDMYDGARLEILHLVYSNVFPKFLELFENILNPTRV
ncbi:hypothetical protein H4R34_003080 [Dimargaris verticillata]|uniref:RGS domain-containing protein n=1 Tax=Dimargaris verticillata TaxID=2761393 RepID=A0A9W8B1C8_9FUNG|nr:hypothetical protein H4R34_003080 [Dimargaris verticillata]